jgi:hypothetical protein
MKILPNGNVQISNSQTGETKEITPNQLPMYGMPVPSNYGEQLKYVQDQANAGAYATLKGQGLSDTQIGPDLATRQQQLANPSLKVQTPQEQTQTAEFTLRAQAAKRVNDALVSGDQNALDAAAADYNKLAPAQSQIPMNAKGPGLISALTGKLTGQLPKITYSVDQGQKDKIKAELNQTAGLAGQTLPDIPQSQPQQFQGQGIDSFAPLGLQVGKDIHNLANGILGLPKAVIDNYNEVQAKDPGKFPSVNSLVLNFGKNAAAAYIQNLNQDLGKPLEGGDIACRAAQNFQQRPVSTVLDALPFIQGAAELKGASTASKVSKMSELPAISAESPLNTTRVMPEIKPPGIRGTLSNMVSNVSKSDLVGSEASIQDVIVNTKSATPYGMTKEIKTSLLPKTRDFIQNVVSRIDQQHPTPIPVASFEDAVKSYITDHSTSFSASEWSEVQATMQDSLAKVTNPAKAYGITPSLQDTNYTSLNKLRVALNNKIPESWFKEMPTATAKDIANMNLWRASEAIRNILTNADSTGELGKVISLQHHALVAYPQLSGEFQGLKTPATLGRMVNRATAGVAVDISKIAAMKGLRATAGDRNLLPIIENSPAAGASATLQTQPITPMERRPLPQDIQTRAVESKGTAQQNRIVRDMRYATGNFRPVSNTPPSDQVNAAVQSRLAQEKLLRNTTKRRYK